MSAINGVCLIRSSLNITYTVATAAVQTHDLLLALVDVNHNVN
jgi:hypothetical protein